MSGFFIAGGTMRPDAASYIPRAADQQLYEAVLAGEYCTVLTTRQMGKSSLMARTAARLREQGVACATVDLQGKGGKTPPPEQWYYGVVKQIADGLELDADWAGWWKNQQMLLPAQRMTDFFADVVLKHIATRVVVFIDEVDWMIRLPFSDEFFAAVRSCYNRRATDVNFERLTFVLLGSAAPAQLIKDSTRTPFNVGRGIALTDFTSEEASPLADHLGGNGQRTLARILYWTDGHPYLTQILCAKLLEHGAELDHSTENDSPEKTVDTVVQDKLLSASARLEENNLKFVADRLTQATRDLRRVLGVYRDVLRGKAVKDKPVSPVHTSLRLSGVVKADAERHLQVRNRVYRQVFNETWVREKTPFDFRWVVAGLPAVILIAVLAWPGPSVSIDSLEANWTDRLLGTQKLSKDSKGFGVVQTAPAQELDPWSTAQTLNAILRGAHYKDSVPNLRAAFESIETARSTGAGGSTGWVTQPGSSWTRTEVSAWVALAYLAALRDKEVWDSSETPLITARVLSLLSDIAARQNPETRGWGPIAQHPPRSDRTYPTILALWSLVEARRTDPVAAMAGDRFDVTIRTGINDLMSLRNQTGWFASTDGTEKHPGLTAQTLYVLSLAAADRSLWFPGDFDDFNATQKTYLESRFPSNVSYHDTTTLHGSDLYLRDEHGVPIAEAFYVTFLPFPWTVAWLGQMAADNAEDHVLQSKALRLRSTLLKQLGSKEAENYFRNVETYFLAESLIGVEASGFK